MKSDDASFELAISNSIQKLTLYHRSSAYKSSYKNVVTRSIGLVFVNYETKGKPYNKTLASERLKHAESRMKNMWKVNDLKIYENKSKEDIVKAFEWL